MLIALVQFQVHDQHTASFREAVLRQAQNSLEREPGCRRFDVCFDPETPRRFLLYEIYDDPATFDAHRKTEHFQQFDATVADWVESKDVSLWEGLELTPRSAAE